MLLCALPEDVLAAVLERCVGASYDAVYGLKRSLPLLAVCRLWRRLAAPLVYTHAFVQYGGYPRPKGPLARNSSVDEPISAAAKTNLNLIMAAGCARAVKRVEIDVRFLANPFPAWHEAIKRARSVASKWRAAELSVAMHPDFHHFDDNNVDMAKYTDDIAEVGDALAALMPDLRRLECGGADSNPIARSLYGRLASNYAGQLEWLDSGHAIAVPPDCHFTRLKKAVVSYGDVADYQLPRMATGELTAMSLLAAPSNHSWAPFSTSSDSRVIEFPRLRQLFVGYRTTYLANGIAVRHRDGHPWRLHFPRLESLRIHNSQQTCPLLDYAELPAHMESIYISMESAAYLNIASVVLPAAKRIDLHITPESHGDTSGLPAINRILESARGAESLELAVEDNTLRVGPGSITCTALTQLAISAPTSVDTMLSLIEGLPNLVKLTVLCLDLSGIQADVSVPGADADASVEPLSMSLESLLIYHDSRGHSPDTAVAVLTHMLLRIPTLSEVYSPQTPEGPVKGFVESYAPRYPHLSGVELTLCRS